MKILYAGLGYPVNNVSNNTLSTPLYYTSEIKSYSIVENIIPKIYSYLTNLYTEHNSDYINYTDIIKFIKISKHYDIVYLISMDDTDYFNVDHPNYEFDYIIFRFNKANIKYKIISIKDLCHLLNIPSINIEHYSNNLKSDYEIVTIPLTRGCYNKCTFCKNTTNYEERNIQDIVSDLLFHYSYGKRKYYFLSLTVSNNILKKLTEFIRLKNLQIEYVITTRVIELDEMVIENLKNTGCTSVFLGIESLNDDRLKLLNKNLNRNEIDHTLNILKKYKLDYAGTIILGDLHSTLTNIKNEIKEVLLNYPELWLTKYKNFKYSCLGSKTADEFTKINITKISNKDYFNLGYLLDIINMYISIGEIDKCIEIFL